MALLKTPVSRVSWFFTAEAQVLLRPWTGMKPLVLLFSHCPLWLYSPSSSSSLLHGLSRPVLSEALSHYLPLFFRVCMCLGVLRCLANFLHLFIWFLVVLTSRVKIRITELEHRKASTAEERGDTGYIPYVEDASHPLPVTYFRKK